MVLYLLFFLFCSAEAETTCLDRCERVLHFMGREVTGRQKFRIQAFKWVVAKLQADVTASFFRKMSGREVTGRESASQSPVEVYDLWNSANFAFLDCFLCGERLSYVPKLLPSS